MRWIVASHRPLFRIYSARITSASSACVTARIDAGDDEIVPEPADRARDDIGRDDGRFRRNVTTNSGPSTRRDASIADIVKVSVYMPDLGEWEAMNRAYLDVFGSHSPPRIAVGCTSLLFARAEFDCVAYRG
jgi:hypothetical protein